MEIIIRRAGYMIAGFRISRQWQMIFMTAIIELQYNTIDQQYKQNRLL